MVHENFNENHESLNRTLFIKCRRQHLRAIEQRRYSRFNFDENTISNSPKVPRAKFLGSDRIFCFSSICTFGSIKNSFATITSLSDTFFRFRRFVLLVQTEKLISMNYGSSASLFRPWRWVRFDQILTTRNICINFNLNPPAKFQSAREYS